MHILVRHKLTGHIMLRPFPSAWIAYITAAAATCHPLREIT